MSLGRDPRHVDGVPHSPGRSQQLGAQPGAANCARHRAGDDGLGNPLDLRAPEIRLDRRLRRVEMRFKMAGESKDMEKDRGFWNQTEEPVL